MCHSRLPGVQGCKDDAPLHNGAKAEFCIPNFELGQLNFAILFYFINKTVTQVTFKSEATPVLEHFRTVAKALRAKYGHEISYKEGEDELDFSTAEWLADDAVNIMLVFSPIVGVLNINYQCRSMDEAGKL